MIAGRFRIGTRASNLAMAQSQQVASALLAAGYESELVPMVTKGDQVLDRALDKVGGKGIFTTELETALLEGQVDLVVHSLKDLPTTLMAGLEVAAYALPDDPRDVLVANPDMTLERLPQGAVIGTSSIRRTAFLRAMRPDLEIVPVRGNLQTRLAKWHAQGMDGLVLAAAGVHRLQWHDLISSYLDPREFVPAPGQGILAVQIRAQDEVVGRAVGRLNDPAAELRAHVERKVLEALGGGCQVPLGVYAQIKDDMLMVTARIVAQAGNAGILVAEEGLAQNQKKVAQRVVDRLVAEGAQAYIEDLP